MEWYRGNDWDKETQELFEQKLKKSRGTYYKSQYMMIKANYLLGSGDTYKEKEGCKLMERLIAEYPSEISHVMFAYEQLGDFYAKKGEYENAEKFYRQSISNYSKNGRGGTSGIGDIKLAEVIINSNQTDKFEETYKLLKEDFHKTGGDLMLNDDKYRYARTIALLANSIDYISEAKEFAEVALKISEIKNPQLDKYPKLGIVKSDKDEISILKEIIER